MIHKLTKIVATIGPVTESEEMIERLISEGVNIFRFNFKHNTMDWHSERIERVNKVAKHMGLSVGTLIDLQGPEIRINMPTDFIEVHKNDLLLFGQEAFESKEKGLSISHPEIIEHLTEGQKLLADDGVFTFYVQKKDGKVYLHCESDGKLLNKKSLNIPGADFPFPVLVERDFEGLQVAARNEVDYVALSFVRTATDLQVVRSEMDKYKVHAKIVAKIETKKAIDNLDEIIDYTDAVMVARGDLGVELPIEQVPHHQKVIIKKCLEKGIPVITATQMLQSMVDNPYPTRAEVSDIANATYDFTDAIMLSGETASGKYPVEAVMSMQKTAKYNEQMNMCPDIRTKFDFKIKDQTDIMCDAAYSVYLSSLEEENDIQAFVVFTETGRTAQALSRYRPKVPVYAITPDSEIAESLTICYGVTPIPGDQVDLDEKEVDKVGIMKTIHFLFEHKYITFGQKVIILHGDIWGVEGGTSTVKILQVA